MPKRKTKPDTRFAEQPAVVAILKLAEIAKARVVRLFHVTD
jgi:hypothetical protein